MAWDARGGMGGFVPVAGLASLVEQLDLLARRRPRRDPPVPTIFFTGRHAEAFVRGYRDRLMFDGRATVPHVLLEGGKGESSQADTAFFDAMADGLAKSMPSGMRGMWGLRGLRLPRYRTVRHVLEFSTTAASHTARRRQLRDHLYAERGELLGAPAGWLRPVSRWLKELSISWLPGKAVAEAAEAASKFLFGLRLRLSPRFAWLKAAIVKTGAREDFLGSGLQLVVDRPAGQKATLVQQVLASALLHDLQAATRRSLVSPFRRRRVTPFVVLLVDVAAGSPASRFVDTLGSVEATAPRRHAVMVLASPAPVPEGDEPLGPGAAPTYSPTDAAIALEPLVERGKALPFRALWVDADGPSSSRDESWFHLHTVVQPMPVRGALAVPVVVVALPLAICLGWLLDRISPDGHSRCPEEVSGEVIGIGDGTTGCSFFPDAADTLTEVDDAMAAVEAAIASENATVVAEGQRYSTIVFFAPLTVPPGQGRLGENALNQLRGTALAQARANERAAGDPDRVLTRVLLANPGDRFANGAEVAEQIVERAEQDETIVGVVGIGQSRRASRDAIGLLGDHRLPVVAGPVTGDAMVDASPHYYQVSPRNRRVARMLVDFSTSTEIVRVGDGTAVPEGAVIVMDHSDEYSRNLAYDLHAAFVDTGRSVDSLVTYPVEDDQADLPDPPTDDAPDPTRVGSLDELAQQVCSSLDERDVVFYASRSQQFVGMLQSMHDNNDCPDTFTVVGGSALTKIVEGPLNPLPQYQGVSLYYAAFASQRIGFNRVGDEFMRRYEEAYGADVVAPDISDGAVAFDAFTALQLTANYAVQNGHPISADTSAQALGGEEIEFDGASGYVVLGNGPIDSDSPRVPPDKPVLVLPAGEAGADPTLVCGRFSEASREDTWGATIPCPTVD